MPEDDLPPMREPVVGKTVHPETAAKLQDLPPEHIARREPTLGEAGKAARPEVKPAARQESKHDAEVATAAAHAAGSSADADEIVADEVAVAASPTMAQPPSREAQADEDGDHAQTATMVAPAPKPAAPEAAPAAMDGQPAQAVIDPLIDCIVPMHLERKASGDRILPADGPAAPRRHQAGPYRGPACRSQRMGAGDRRPPVRGHPGRRAAGQPQRPAERARVLRVRQRRGGVGRGARCVGGPPRHDRDRGQRPRAGRLCRRRRRATGRERDFRWRAMVGRLCADRGHAGRAGTVPRRHALHPL